MRPKKRLRRGTRAKAQRNSVGISNSNVKFEPPTKKRNWSIYTERTEKKTRKGANVKTHTEWNPYGIRTKHTEQVLAGPDSKRIEKTYDWRGRVEQTVTFQGESKKVNTHKIRKAVRNRADRIRRTLRRKPKQN